LAGNAATIIGAARPEPNLEIFMKVHICRRPNQLAVICALAALAACTNAGTSEPRIRQLPPVGAEVMTETEITGSQALTAYDAIQRSHPRFLTTKVDLAASADREVYLNGIHLGGIGELRGIPASSVHEIRFVRAIDGAASGIGRTGGAILVISKAGR
jgi:hypothetical protein